MSFSLCVLKRYYDLIVDDIQQTFPASNPRKVIPNHVNLYRNRGNTRITPLFQIAKSNQDPRAIGRPASCQGEKSHQWQLALGAFQQARMDGLAPSLVAAGTVGVLGCCRRC